MKKVKLIAIIAAAIAGIGVFFFLQEIGKTKEAPHTEVVVAVVDIPENTKITEDMVEIRSVPDEVLQENYLLEIESVIDLVTSSDIYAGDQITKNRLAPTSDEDVDNKTLAYVIENGKRAITIGVNTVTGMENLIKPGNRVDLITGWVESSKESSVDVTENTAESNSTEKKENSKSKIFLQNLKVLAVGTELAKNGLPEYLTLTLEVTPEEAVIIDCIDRTISGIIRVILRSPLDNEIIEGPAVEYFSIIEEDEKQ